MTKVRLKYLHCFTDRHGKPHCYFRYRGDQWRLPAPGTEDFASEYDALLSHIKANPLAIKTGRIDRGYAFAEAGRRKLPWRIVRVTTACGIPLWSKN
jgi:hypothetical protein